MSSALRLLQVTVVVATALWPQCRANVIIAVSDAAANATAAADNASSTAAPDGTSATATESPPPTIVVYNATAADESRDSRFLSFSLGSADDQTAAATNALQEKQQEEAAADPSAHLVDIYTDCLMQLSFPCVQRKLLLFLDKLGRMKGETTCGPGWNLKVVKGLRFPGFETIFYLGSGFSYGGGRAARKRGRYYRK